MEVVRLGIMSLPSLDEVVLDDLHQWLDGIPFSRIRKSIVRDFSDGGKGLLFVVYKAKRVRRK